MAIKPKDSPLVEAVRKLVIEALNEAGPVGYLSKTKRPDSKTMWNPEKQQDWAQQNTPGTVITGTETTGLGPLGPRVDEPTMQPAQEPTLAGIPSAQKRQQKLPPAPVPAPTTSPGIPSAKKAPGTSPTGVEGDIGTALQGATPDQIKQIWQILGKTP